MRKNIIKANRPRKVSGMTRNGKVSFKSLNAVQLKQLLEKTTRPRDRQKINSFLDVKC